MLYLDVHVREYCTYINADLRVAGLAGLAGLAGFTGSTCSSPAWVDLAWARVGSSDDGEGELVGLVGVRRLSSLGAD